ncbi:DUF664 domain-containing protein [Streptomyces sp. Tue6028]
MTTHPATVRVPCAGGAETARHAGHTDVVRELIDGATGGHRPG